MDCVSFARLRAMYRKIQSRYPRKKCFRLLRYDWIEMSMPQIRSRHSRSPCRRFKYPSRLPGIIGGSIRNTEKRRGSNLAHF